MADADASNYVKVREENGRLYIGDSDRAYIKEAVWTMFVQVRDLRYVEHYDHEDQEKYRLMRSIRGKMSCDKDEFGILGAPSVLLRRGETAEIELSPTLDQWVTRDGFEWTLAIHWDDTFWGSVALPDDVFDRIAGQVIAGQITTIAVGARGGMYVSIGDACAPERYTMRFYLKPGNGGRTDRPEYAVNNVTSILVRCGEASPDGEDALDKPRVDEWRDGVLEGLRGIVESNLMLTASLRTRTVSSAEASVIPLLIAIMGVLSYLVFWK